MDFQFNDEQLALQNGLKDFCQKRATMDQLKHIESQGGFDTTLWQEIAELGVFSISEPTERNGMAKGCVEACICLEEMGRSIVPGPLVWTCLGASVVKGVSEGTTIVSGLDFVSNSQSPLMIEHYQYIDTLLLLKPDGIYEVACTDLEVEALEKYLDPFTPVHYARTLPSANKIADADTANTLWLKGACLASAQLLGFAQQTLSMACDYAKQRQQFDKPIGQFQSIKHMLSDMFVRQEIARSATYAAAACMDDPGAGNLQRLVSSAKLNATEAAMKNAKACIQIFGGMGYTWEIPAHYYLKRSWVLAALFGDVGQHADIIADSVALEVD